MECKEILLGQLSEACKEWQSRKNVILIEGVTKYYREYLTRMLTKMAQLKPVQDTSS